MILVDSSVWIDYFNGKLTQSSEFLDAILGVENIIMGDLIIAEVLQGFRSDNDFKKAKSLLLAFDVHQLLNETIAIKSAENFRLLRKKGITVRKTIDSIIATYCIENQISLLHSDKDFLPFSQYLGLHLLPAQDM